MADITRLHPTRRHLRSGPTTWIRLLGELAQEPVLALMAGTPLTAALAAGPEPVRAAPELERALQTPTREATQARADEATFRRRADAVEQERAIAENELANSIELARRRQELIEREGEGTRRRAELDAEAARVNADAEAERARLTTATDADRARVLAAGRPTGWSPSPGSG